jgi:hypothetical protein
MFHSHIQQDIFDRLHGATLQYDGTIYTIFKVIWDELQFLKHGGGTFENKEK